MLKAPSLRFARIILCFSSKAWAFILKRNLKAFQAENFLSLFAHVRQ
jgi:hypothetical protein